MVSLIIMNKNSGNRKTGASKSGTTNDVPNDARKKSTRMATGKTRRSTGKTINDDRVTKPVTDDADNMGRDGITVTNDADNTDAKNSTPGSKADTKNVDTGKTGAHEKTGSRAAKTKTKTKTKAKTGTRAKTRRVSRKTDSV